MHNNKSADNITFHNYCDIDTPLFCRFHSGGSALHRNVDFYEFCIITGSYRCLYQGQSTLVQTGTILFFKPGESYALLQSSPNSHHYSFIAKIPFFEEYCKTNLPNYEEILTSAFRETELLGVQFAYLSYLCDTLISTELPEQLLFAKHLFSSIAFSCFCTLPKSFPNFSTNVYAKDLLQRLNSFQFLNKEISEWYDYYPVSQTALINDFRKLTGYTIVQYRNKKRMEHAANMLTNSTYSVTAIANMLNISSLGYFSQQFKKQYGVTPTEYQQLHSLDEKPE